MKMTRQQTLEFIRQHPEVSVLIIGGGINGIGTFRDLALQGVDVLLVEKGDFASGASAASSHMLHGGLRYLENGEFRLVSEALHERNRMLQNAPHYAHPLPTTIPIFKRFSGVLNAPLKFLGLLDRPGERGALVIKIGLMLYDWFTRDARMTPTHRFYGRAESLKKRPLLNPDILCTATYYDAWMPYPERICIELLADGEEAGAKARALNYVAAVDGAGDSVTLRDELTGETFGVKPKIVINAAGPWIDFVNRALGQATQFIGGTKGAHLMIDHPDLLEACAGHELFFENKDGRITLFFPLLDRVLAGTTDIKIDDPEQARVTDEEIDYILSAIRLVFPGIDVNRSHVVFWFTGVRPLPSSSAATAGQISRDHSIQEVPSGSGLNYPIYSLVGGKWTSFRAFSEQAADRVLGELNIRRQVSTAQRAIGGGRDYPKIDADRRAWLLDLRAKTEIELDRLAELFDRYGTYAADVAAFIVAGDDQPLAYTPGYSRREVLFIAQNEHVARLDDFLLRRSLLAMLGKVNAASLAELGGVVGEALGWSAETTEAEIKRAAEILRTRHGMNLGEVASGQ
jgi:glycerol-3-phosphate dehydrogenase